MGLEVDSSKDGLWAHADLGELPALFEKQMKLEQLRINFLEATDAQRQELFDSYYSRRQRDLEQVVIKVPKKRAKGKKASERKIPVTPDQLQMLRKLGLV